MGSSRSLRNMLDRSLGARNFSTFWNYWNPIFGYYLGKHVFKPLKRILPAPLALLATFLVCGLVHDMVTTMVRRHISLFFTQWFLLMGIWVIVTRLFKQNLANQPWLVRATMNVLPIVATFCIISSTNRYAF